jgi:leucyl aminopeptidase
MLSFSAFNLSSKPLLLIGEKSRLTKDVVTKLLKLDAKAAARLSLASKSFTANAASYVETEAGSDRLVRLAYLSDKSSRHMGILRQDLIPKLISSNLPDPEEPCQLVMCLKHKDELFAASSAVAKAFPLYSKKAANLKKLEAQVDVSFLLPNEEVSEAQLKTLEELASSVRVAQLLVDTPPTDLNTKEYALRVEKYVSGLKDVTYEAIVGEELKSKGLNALYSVGKAAVEPARLVVLKYAPAGGDQAKSIAFVGKGITYDTGGLSIKSTANMCNMKTDMVSTFFCIQSDISGRFCSLSRSVPLPRQDTISASSDCNTVLGRKRCWSALAQERRHCYSLQRQDYRDQQHRRGGTSSAS